MSKYKFYGSNHPNSVPDEILSRRLETASTREKQRALTRAILGGTAIGAVAVGFGYSAVNFNRAHPVTKTPVEQASTPVNSATVPTNPENLGSAER